MSPLNKGLEDVGAGESNIELLEGTHCNFPVARPFLIFHIAYNIPTGTNKKSVISPAGTKIKSKLLTINSIIATHSSPAPFGFIFLKCKTTSYLLSTIKLKTIRPIKKLGIEQSLLSYLKSYYIFYSKCFKKSPLLHSQKLKTAVLLHRNYIFFCKSIKINDVDLPRNGANLRITSYKPSNEQKLYNGTPTVPLNLISNNKLVTHNKELCRNSVKQLDLHYFIDKQKSYLHSIQATLLVQISFKQPLNGIQKLNSNKLLDTQRPSSKRLNVQQQNDLFNLKKLYLFKTNLWVKARGNSLLNILLILPYQKLFNVLTLYYFCHVRAPPF